MDATNPIEALLDEAYAALIRLDAEQLEVIEMSLVEMSDSLPKLSLTASSAVRPRLTLLGQGLAMTETNLSVLERIASSRRAVVS